MWTAHVMIDQLPTDKNMRTTSVGSLMRFAVVLLCITVGGCNTLLGTGQPGLAGDAVAPTDGPSDAATDGPPADAGIDAPAAVGSFGVETSNNGAVSFVGGFTVQVTCNANGTVCATGGLQ
jgi:predicted small secreted protein